MSGLVRKMLVITVLFTVFISSHASPCQGAWTCQFELWSSPYHDQKIYAGALNYSWKFREELYGKIILPLRVTSGPAGRHDELFFPRFALCWLQPFGQEVTGKLKIKCDPQHQAIHLDGGLELLSDPLLTYCSVAHQSGANFLNMGVIFAVNEKWALGAHLKYGKNSLLAYQLHHITTRGNNGKLSYSYSPDGSMQCLGLEIAF